MQAIQELRLTGESLLKPSHCFGVPASLQRPRAQTVWRLGCLGIEAGGLAIDFHGEVGEARVFEVKSKLHEEIRIREPARHLGQQRARATWRAPPPVQFD